MSSLKNHIAKMEADLFNDLYPSSLEITNYISVLSESELSKGDINKVFKVAVAKRGDGKGALSKAKDMKDTASKDLASLKSNSKELASKIGDMIDSGKVSAEQAKAALEKYLLTALEKNFSSDGLDIDALGEDIYSGILSKVTARMIEEGISESVIDYHISVSSFLVEGPLDGIKDAAKKLGKRTRILDRGKVDISDLQNAWIANGKPTDSEEIEEILQAAGFTSGEINRAFDSAGVSRDNDHDANIVELSRIIKDLELTPFVIKYLERFGITESTNLNEKVIADRDIRAMFVKLLSKTQPDSPDDHASSSSSVQQYVNKWESELKRLDNDNEIPKGHEVEHEGDVYRWLGAQWVNTRNKRIAKRDIGRGLSSMAFDELNAPKVALVKEIVNFLADRHGTTEWKQVVKGVKRIIDASNVGMEVQDAAIKHLRDGTTMESQLFDITNDFLSETGFGWEDIGVQPCKVDEDVVSLRSLIGPGVLSEDFFKSVLESHTYGRRRKP